MDNKITLFKDDNGYLSNFFPHTVYYEGEAYPSVEYAFQAAKALKGDFVSFTDGFGRKVVKPARQYIREAESSGQAKKRGRRITLRPGWDEMKLEVMELLVRQKFANPKLATRLLNTGDAELIEGNWWGDVYWGMCQGKGENHLGRILTKVRDDIRTVRATEKGG